MQRLLETIQTQDDRLKTSPTRTGERETPGSRQTSPVENTEVADAPNSTEVQECPSPGLHTI